MVAKIVAGSPFISMNAIDAWLLHLAAAAAPPLGPRGWPARSRFNLWRRHQA
jgi:hypothetical protein